MQNLKQALKQNKWCDLEQSYKESKKWKTLNYCKELSYFLNVDEKIIKSVFKKFERKEKLLKLDETKGR